MQINNFGKPLNKYQGNKSVGNNGQPPLQKNISQPLRENEARDSVSFTGLKQDFNANVVNPQGGINPNPLLDGGNMRSSGGGQLTFVKDVLNALAQGNFNPAKEVKVQVIPTPSGEVKVLINPAQHQVNAVGVGQQFDDACFEGRFAQSVEKTPDGVTFVRAPLTREGKYVDKEDVRNGENVFYKHLGPEYLQKVAKTLKENGLTGDINISGYVDGYLVAHNAGLMNKKGQDTLPGHAWVLHSAGGPKMKNMLLEQIGKNLEGAVLLNQQKKGSDQLSPQELTKQIVLNKLGKLLGDPQFMFPSRILAERIAFTDPTTQVVVNSPFERDQQIAAYPYNVANSMEKYGLYEVDKAKINVITPGVDRARFLRNDETKPHIEKAMNIFEKRYGADIPLERQRLENVLTTGRLDQKKNFHGMIKAFIASPELRSKANLVLVINGKKELEGENFLKTAQDLLKANNPQAAQFLKEKCGINNADYLLELAQLVNDNEEVLKGVITSVALPNGNDFGGLKIGLAEKGKTVGGLNSLQEPYGLIIAEEALAGLVGPCAKNAGVYAELKDLNVFGFDPNKPEEIANAYLKTIDNKDQLQGPLQEWANGKTWERWCQNVLDLGENKGWVNTLDYVQKNHPKVYSEPINYTDKKFQEKGINLILDATNAELDKGADGVFGQVLQDVQQMMADQNKRTLERLQHKRKHPDMSKPSGSGSNFSA